MQDIPQHIKATPWLLYGNENIFTDIPIAHKSQLQTQIWAQDESRTCKISIIKLLICKENNL